jgi:hypothetical protein
MANSLDLPYRIVYPEKVRGQILALTERTTAIGSYPQFLQALRAIVQRLTSDPLAWGDPNYRLRNLDLVKCHGIHSILHVYYAVDEQRRIVYLTDVQAFPGTPLAGAT